MQAGRSKVSLRARGVEWNVQVTKGNGAGYHFLVGLIGHQGDECVTWPLFRDKCGRGRVGHDGHHYWAHRLMCQIAHGDPPTPKHTAAHNCGKGHEGCVNPKHLEWKTQAENLADCAIHGTQPTHSYGNKGRLTRVQAQEIRDARGIKTQRELASEYGVSEGAINDIWRGRSHARPSKIPHYTPDDDAKIRTAIARGCSFPEIAAEVGRPTHAVAGRAYRLGLKSGRPSTRDDYNSIRRS